MSLPAERNLSITAGDAAEALSIMREAAEILAESGDPMWDPDEFTRENYPNPPDDFLVMWSGDESAAAVILSFEDKFLWPDIPEGTSGFLHKLAVRRKFRGLGMPEKIIRHAIELCGAKGVSALRLDCDAHRTRLRDLYESLGFRLKEVRVFNSKRYGVLDTAFYELFF